jgi:hypothetical protein
VIMRERHITLRRDENGAGLKSSAIQVAVDRCQILVITKRGRTAQRRSRLWHRPDITAAGGGIAGADGRNVIFWT